MRPGTVICEGVGKRYRLGGLPTLRDRLTFRTGRRTVLWALRDLDFNLQPGSTLGLIGPNGSGKTTALRLLAGITQPSRGRLVVAGRKATLIELGAGFHPELSGRENIDLFGLILGMSRSEVRERLDAIVAFSGLEEFLDTPVKRYSSGMYVRLAFSIAAHVEADVLLVDEVLAVGDASFRQRCVAHMDRLARSGTTLVFVSHNLSHVQRLCERTLLLTGGTVRHAGPTSESIEAYDRLIAESYEDLDDGGGEIGSHLLSLRNVRLERGDEPLHWRDTLRVSFEYCAARPIADATPKAWIVRADGTVCAFSAPYMAGDPAWRLEGAGGGELIFEPVQLASGRYRLVLRMVDASDAVVASAESTPFEVRGPALPHQPDIGVFVPTARWRQVGSAGDPAGGPGGGSSGAGSPS